MKRLFIALSLVAASASIPTLPLSREKAAALVQMIVGGGTVGLTASLLQDTSNNIVVEGAKHLYAQAGFGSCISQIRVQMQQWIHEMHDGSPQQTLDIEKMIYIAAGLIGAALVLDSIVELISDEKTA